MTPEQHARVKELFFEARELDAESRTQFLKRETGGDIAILNEVHSLLAYDDTTTLLGGTTRPVPQVPLRIGLPGGRSRRWGGVERAATRILRQIFGPWDRRLLVTLITISAMIGLAIWMYWGMKRRMETLAASELRTILDADATALELWIQEKKKDVRLWSSRKDFRRAVTELVELDEGRRRSGEDLLASPAQAQLRKLFEEYDRIVGRPEQDGVITQDGFFLASELAMAVGGRLNTKGLAAIAPIFAGETLFLKPHPDGFYGVERELDLAVPVVYVVAPVRGLDEDEDKIMAAAGFGFPADGEFTRILSVARVGETGETYLFDLEGQLLSESRFDDQLQASGFLPPGARSIFRIDVRDPGVRLPRQPLSELEMANLPLTELARRTIAAARKGTDSEQQGVILDPYRNYRGAVVVGAWKWLPEYALGVANEVEVAELYSPMRYPLAAEAIRFGLLAICITSLLIAACWIANLGDDVEQARQLGQYTLEQKIGEGGMGVVYRARHALLHRATAIKVVHPQILNEESLARFEREVQLASGLTHPNTIEIFDFGRAIDGSFYCAMEYLDGQTLERIVRAEGPLQAGRATRLLIQIAGSLREAHEKQLVHRDIKPSNIMLCDRGGITDFVKVLDFGLARNVERSGDTGISKQGFLAGTPSYMAPERISDPGSIDRRSDIYSLGAVGYFMLTGRRVYETRDPIELVGQILDGRPQPPSQHTSQAIPGELEALLMRCLAKHSEDRPASVKEILSMLHSSRSETEDGWG